MESVQKQFFRDQLRSGRAAALADAEGFQAVLHALELIGQQLVGKVNSLGGYLRALSDVASASPLSNDTPLRWPGYHATFYALFNELRQARNDAVHQGAYARTITNHAVELTIILEDALMSNASMVSQFMVRDVIEAKPWHPVSHVRQQMLKHGFSYLPFRHQNSWMLIPEYTVVRYLRRSSSQKDRSTRLATKVCCALAANELELLPTCAVAPETPIEKILQCVIDRPILVVDRAHEDVLAGVLTASDL